MELIKDSNRGPQPSLIRASSQVIVQAPVRGLRQGLSLGRLPHRTDPPTRDRHVFYHRRKAEPVDVIVHRGARVRASWVSPGAARLESWLPTEEVVQLYRNRLQIEPCFRDGKSHRGLRGLHLPAEKSQRWLRLRMGFTLAYRIVLLLGQDPLAERLRPFFEQPRGRPPMGPPRCSMSCRSLCIGSLIRVGTRWRESAG